jgi:ABC-type transport system involved in multi-copper enzyme maturation permease subunit
MLSILKIEWLKIRKYPAFWWMLGIVALTYPGINFIFYKIYEGFVNKKDISGAVAHSFLGNPFAFPETWHSVAYFSSFFVIVPSILVIMIITNEYTFKTNRQNIIDGWSRNQFVTGKILDVAIIAIVATLTFFLTATYFGLTNKEADGASWTEGFKYVPLFLLQTFAQLSIAFLLGFLIRKSFIALGIFIFYYLILENIIVGILNFTKVPIGRFFPLAISHKLIPGPKFFSHLDEASYNENLLLINQHIIYTIILTAGIWLLVYWVYNKRDI